MSELLSLPQVHDEHQSTTLALGRHLPNGSFSSISAIVDQDSSIDTEDLKLISDKSKEISKDIEARITALSKASANLYYKSSPRLEVPHSKEHSRRNKQKSSKEPVQNAHHDAAEIFNRIKSLNSELAKAENKLLEEQSKVHETEKEREKLNRKLNKIEKLLKVKAQAVREAKNTTGCIVF
jgi:chromosome segregation ATPase